MTIDTIEARPRRDPTTRYEARDVPGWVPVLVAAMTALTITCVLGILVWVYPTALRDRVFIPARPAPAPLLQTSPRFDMGVYRANVDAYLHSYGWVDRGAGLVHIPIDRAIADLVRQGRGDWKPADAGEARQ